MYSPFPDHGKQASAASAAARLNLGEQVLAVDLPFTGDAWNQDTTWMFEHAWLLEQNLYATGDRPLGIEAAHLIALANWMKRQGAGKVRLETSGLRNHVVALVASALEPSLFCEVLIRHGMPSLRYLVDKPVKYHDAQTSSASTFTSSRTWIGLAHLLRQRLLGSKPRTEPNKKHLLATRARRVATPEPGQPA
jgi:hypothetical protein